MASVKELGEVDHMHVQDVEGLAGLRIKTPDLRSSPRPQTCKIYNFGSQ